MNIAALIGIKIDQTQGFLEDGTRVPLSLVSLAGNTVTQKKTSEKEGYHALQIGIGTKKKPTKAILGHAKKSGLTDAPRFLREIRSNDAFDVEAGTAIVSAEVFEAGDVVDVVGLSKGKGFAGGVKLHHFKGGPKTHGQSDRHRAPGSIGQGTTPGRVYKGKRMAGRMGNNRVTVKNLEVLDIDGDTLYIRGLIPGIKGGMVMVSKVGKNKKFTPLFKKIDEVPIEEIIVENIAEIMPETPVVQEESLAEQKTDDSVTESVANEADVEVVETPQVEETVTQNAEEQEVKEEAK